MATLNLTDRTVRNAKAGAGQRVELWDTHTRGLCLRVSPESKTWLVRYRAGGKQRRFTLGDLEDLELPDARIQAAALLRAVKKEGCDPAGDLGEKKAAAKAEPIKTFSHLADDYLAACKAGLWTPKGKRQSARTLADIEGSLTRHIRPRLGDKRLQDVDRHRIKALLADMRAAGIGAQVNKAHDVLRQIFAYALHEHDHLIAHNPALGIQRVPVVPRERVLSDPELKALWGGLTAPGALRIKAEHEEDENDPVYLSRPMAIALQLTTLLLQRRNEIAGMMASEVNLDEATWLIPAVRMKGRRPHLVPLPPKAVTLIKEALKLSKARQADRKPAPKDYPVFPSPRDPAKAFKPDSLTHALAAVLAALEIEGASTHDLRRTGSTAMTSERLGVSPFIRSKVLGHADAGGGAVVSARHYDANTYIAEKRRALAAWEGLLLEIVGEKARPSNVHPIGEAAA
jgi:integrase